MGSLKIDLEVARDTFVSYVVTGDKPFNMVDDRRFRNWVKYISPTLKLPTRNTVKSDIVKVHKREAVKLKKILVSIANRICLTSDLWTSSTNEGYICLTAHFVDENWKLQNNASSNDTCVDHLKSTLDVHGSLLCGGEFFHVRCSAHILNLIVQDGMKIYDIEGLEYTTTLCLDVPTKWNSLYTMLASAIPYKKIFEMYKVKEDEFRDSCPSSNEWKRTEKICGFLLPFYETTKLMSGTSYPTSNLYILQVWQIQLILMNSLKNDEVLIRHMGEQMMIKFKKYWDEYSVGLAFGTVLDPRFKLNTLAHCYNEIDPISTKDKVEHVKILNTPRRDSIHSVKAVPLIVHQSLLLWIDKRKTEVISVDDSLYVEQMHVNFKVYNYQLKPLDVDRNLNLYNCEGYFLTTEGLNVKLSGSSDPVEPIRILNSATCISLSSSNLADEVDPEPVGTSGIPWSHYKSKKLVSNWV
ncbi:zinc finger BED domain-containing protein RICESLEEPER 2-like [Arachis ipaensis]|uniref:zinc finger BED domain-containing protein RICESLEEPER 2-like n=1 Tax=Arachis ipaensis TaxID=130454 RepID=UPI0007AF39C0|nr:zinc finger BED domain-containing protein RICESLEEPER 2-like [Arachis ipaensis]XP_025665078.1 zinc finger BED domain-containing protein RICESLEEPER 2-like [Arachis hypogaea]